MKRVFLIFISSLFIVSLLSFPAFGEEAADPVSPPSVSSPSFDFPSDITVHVSSVDSLPDDAVLESVSIMPLSIDPGSTPQAPSGSLKAVLNQFLGTYSPTIVEYRYSTSSSGSYSYVREIFPDYPFICGCALLAVWSWCLFRLLGGIISRWT